VIRTVAGYVLEIVGVLLIALALVFLFGPAWGLIPVGVYVIVTGVMVGSGGDA
jgi:hypothetical protein